MDIQVTSSVIEAMRDAAARAHPSEACGILLGEGKCITCLTPAKNVHPTPETHFEIDPMALINAHRSARQGGLKVLGYFHSHPTGDAKPSQTDAAMAAGDGAIWAITGSEKAAFWRSNPEGFEAVSYTLA